MAAAVAPGQARQALLALATFLYNQDATVAPTAGAIPTGPTAPAPTANPTQAGSSTGPTLGATTAPTATGTATPPPPVLPDDQSSPSARPGAPTLVGTVLAAGVVTALGALLV